jgi:uncharacterized membrane protein YdjX (TVP38/TMEM64 family)
MTKTRWAALAALAALIGAFFALGLHEQLTLEKLRASRDAINAYRDAEPVLASLAFVGIYVGVTSLSVPGAGIMTLAGGAIFGLLWGLVMVSFASAIGATVAFLMSRFILHDWVQQHFGNRLKAINAGIRRDGVFYLISLRLIPIFPFFIINVLMGLTPMPARTFYWASQVGMLPLTIVIVNAGTELAKIDHLKDILSPTLIASLVLIGLFPLVARKVVEKINERRHRKKAR